uniref:ATP synthase subunit beta, chloroplastic n=1 Tax=Tanacetum cinerariifolium TaxID=118510 RepID=A0A6L2LQM5_TANCI|nr:ATP synthase subunit beta, chloroplastic [Tanacetum cinerariifolium]
MNAGELLKMDPYDEVAQQEQAHPLSPAYVPDPMELDEHVPVYVLEPEHPKYHALSDDDIQVKDDNEDLKKDPKEDPSEEHEPEDNDEDPEEDPNKEHESKGSEETEPFEEDEIAITTPPPRHRGARISAGQGLIRSLGHDTRTIARVTDRAKDASYVRALQTSERRIMTSIEEVNLRVSYQAHVRRQESENFYTQLLDAQTDHRDIRLKIDVVRGQRTAYETELQETCHGKKEGENRHTWRAQYNRELYAAFEKDESLSKRNDGPATLGKRIKEASDSFMHAPLGSGGYSSVGKAL